jgi:hypothetical protein
MARLRSCPQIQLIQAEDAFFTTVGVKQPHINQLQGALLNNNISIHNKLNNYYLTKMFYQL